MDRDYYCSKKFRHIKIDLESKNTYTCHAATPHKIDINWLKNNPGQLFNTEININERKMMLANVRNPSCEQNCWKAEDIGAPSPRIWQNGAEKTHDKIINQPEIVDLVINSDCNLTCSYCCKEFSKSWRRDLLKNGDYQIDNFNDERFVLSKKDKLLLQVSQKELKKSKHYNFILNEINQSLVNVKSLIITGGEPFLDNGLINFLQNLTVPTLAEIELYSGLGLHKSRFLKMIKSIKEITKKYPNFVISISAENIRSNLEFNRYGIKWKEFDEKINILRDHNINFRFHCTLSNLTMFGFKDFFEYYNENKILTFAYQPRFIASHIIDDESKEQLLDTFSNMPEYFKNNLHNAIKTTPTEEERIASRQYIHQFVYRRKDLDYSIFPKSFINWLQL